MSALRASLRMLYLRMRLMHWLLVGSSALVLFALVLLARDNSLSVRAESAFHAWALMSTTLLCFYGAVLGAATAAAAGNGRALVPGASRALWRAAAAIGLLAIATVSVSILGFAGRSAAPAGMSIWLAGASMSLASGFATTLASSPHRGRAGFIAIALLPLTVWALSRHRDLLAESPATGWLVLWGLAWPACLWHLARVVSSPAHAASAGHGGFSKALARAQSLNERVRRRGFDCARADRSWLMRPPHHRSDLVMVAACFGIAAYTLWTSSGSHEMLWLLSSVLLMSSAISLGFVFDSGLRVCLLLLPGGVTRQALAWSLFREQLKGWSALAITAVLVGAVVAAIGGGLDVALRGLCASVFVAGLVVLLLGCAIALRAKVPQRGQRSSIQLLIVFALIMMAGWVAIGVSDKTLSTAAPMPWGALALGPLLALLGAALVQDSARAWARIDLAQFKRTDRVQPPFGLTIR